VEQIIIPARGEIYFAPGSFAMLVMGIKEDLKPGGKLKLTLIFEKSGKLDSLIDIQAADYQPQ
jgi:copper(I)-binding protein